MEDETPMPINRLILGDNLEIMKSLESESVDLIYLDPPFFSNRTYEVIWGDEGEIRSFEDRWAGGIDHYIMWLKERVEQMHRLLKKTGSIFLHCDWHASAYIRVEILDRIFGMKNFRNGIVWHYTGWNKKLSDSFEKRHDVIFFYAKKITHQNSMVIQISGKMRKNTSKSGSKRYIMMSMVHMCCRTRGEWTTDKTLPQRGDGVWFSGR